MGLELECRLQYRKRKLAGKAYLETDYLLFRGEERLKVPLKDLTAVHAADGLLRLEFPGGPAAFELGAAAEKWAGKILHPPSRADKLGVKAGTQVRLVGDFENDFLAELHDRGAGLMEGGANADLVIFAAATRSELVQIAKLEACLKPAGAIWIVYPKGSTAVREIEVIEAGRGAGLKDTKVASFSATHTALRFVIPVDRRGLKHPL